MIGVDESCAVVKCTYKTNEQAHPAFFSSSRNVLKSQNIRVCLFTHWFIIDRSYHTTVLHMYKWNRTLVRLRSLLNLVLCYEYVAAGTLIFPPLVVNEIHFRLVGLCMFPASFYTKDLPKCPTFLCTMRGAAASALRCFHLLLRPNRHLRNQPNFVWIKPTCFQLVQDY